MNNSKTSLFLMELIIVILLFSISGAVCAQMFFKSNMMNKSNSNLSHANVQIQNLAETYLGLDGNIEDLQSLFPNALVDNDKLCIMYDSEWNEVEKNSSDISYYSLLVLNTPEAATTPGSMSSVSISVYKLEPDVQIPTTLSEFEAISGGQNLIDSQDLNKYSPNRKEGN